MALLQVYQVKQTEEGLLAGILHTITVCRKGYRPLNSKTHYQSVPDIGQKTNELSQQYFKEASSSSGWVECTEIPSSKVL